MGGKDFVKSDFKEDLWQPGHLFLGNESNRMRMEDACGTDEQIDG